MIDLQGHFQGQKGQKPNFVRTSKIWMFSQSSKSGCSHEFKKFKVIIDLQGHFQGQKGLKPNFVRTSKIWMFSQSSKSGCSHKVKKIQGHNLPSRPLSRPKRPKTHLCHKIWMISQSSANEFKIAKIPTKDTDLRVLIDLEGHSQGQQYLTLPSIS